MTSAFAIQELDETALDDGFFDTLSHLKDVGLSPAEAKEILKLRTAQGVRTFIAVQDGKTVGTASLVVEQKFIHQGGKIGHLEDVATRKGHEGQGIGKAVVLHAVNEAWKLGCYKVILASSENHQGFYERCGFRPNEREMRIDRPT